MRGKTPSKKDDVVFGSVQHGVEYAPGKWKHTRIGTAFIREDKDYIDVRIDYMPVRPKDLEDGIIRVWLTPPSDR